MFLQGVQVPLGCLFEFCFFKCRFTLESSLHRQEADSIDNMSYFDKKWLTAQMFNDRRDVMWTQLRLSFRPKQTPYLQVWQCWFFKMIKGRIKCSFKGFWNVLHFLSSINSFKSHWVSWKTHGHKVHRDSSHYKLTFKGHFSTDLVLDHWQCHLDRIEIMMSL